MIEIRHLYKAFDNHMVLRNLNMKINEGAVYGFVGPNGAGKTTTMRIIAGLLKADSGQILIDGEDIDARHKELIGYMPDFFGVYDRLRVKEYMAFFASIYGFDKEETEKKIRQLLELVRLTEKKEAYVDSLSRGMKQRLCLARCMIHDPKHCIIYPVRKIINRNAHTCIRLQPLQIQFTRQPFNHIRHIQHICSINHITVRIISIKLLFTLRFFRSDQCLCCPSAAAVLPSSLSSQVSKTSSRLFTNWASFR